MPPRLRVSLGQCSDKGRKAINQDCHGAIIPAEPLLSTKGVALALSDGISSSDVSHIASESAVKSFLTDYYCTPEAWSVKTSAQRVLAATNSWLHAETRRGRLADNSDRGYVCTLSAAVFKARTVHLFQIGDSRISRVAGGTLEQLTDEHRVFVSAGQSYLGRALGINPQVEIDYRALPIDLGDVFVLATDGVYEHISPQDIVRTIKENALDLDKAAQTIVASALSHGSLDNLTVQIARIDETPEGEADEILGLASQLPVPSLPQARDVFEGCRIVRELHGTSRSHVYLAVDSETDTPVVLKIPSLEKRDDADYLRRFIMEEWIARRIDSPHVLKPHASARRRRSLYVATEFIDGQTLTQWMIDNPRPPLEAVRRIVEQIAAGLTAFHRMEMLHQDLRPDNVMIDRTGTVKIIDFGSTKVAGVVEATHDGERNDILGTAQYTAPEYFIGEGGSPASDLFSLGVIAYQMLTGRLPYGTRVARVRARSELAKLSYLSAQDDDRGVPSWVDGAIRKAVAPDPAKRHEALSEFVFELRHPNPRYLARAHVPWIERDPLLFWKCLSLILTAAIILLLALHVAR
jgi:serine/threonine protein phosphatase PrpC